MNFKKAFIFSQFFMITFLVGCTSTVEEKTPALFDTRKEAKKAAKSFNCTGAHKMGDKWMPCKSHSAHEDKEHNKSNNEHHHHH